MPISSTGQRSPRMVPAEFDFSRFVLPELLLSVFDWLPQKDLLSAAASCRRWRALAFSHPSFYYHLELVVHEVDWTPLHTFCARLRYLRERNLRASVIVDWSWVTPGDLTTDPAGIPRYEVQALDASTTLAIRVVMGTIGDSLSHMFKINLVFGAALKATLEEKFFPHLCRAAAPRLEDFLVQIRDPSPFLEDCAVIPRDLFVGSAPKLWRVVLRGVTVESQSIPAFSAVSEVMLDVLNEAAHLPDLFPRVRQLEMQQIAAAMLPLLYPLASSLRHLKFDIDIDGGTPNLGDALRLLAPVPVVQITFTAVPGSSNGFERLSFVSLFGDLKQSGKKLNMHLMEIQGSTMLLLHDGESFETSAFNRAFGFSGCTADELRAVLTANLRRLASNIGILFSLDEHFLDFLPDIFTTLPEVCRLTVYWRQLPDVVRFPKMTDNRVYCPKLRHLKLIANLGSESRARVQVRAERLRRVLRPGTISVMQQFTDVDLDRHLVQIPGDGDFAVTDSEDGCDPGYHEYTWDRHLVSVMYHVGLGHDFGTDIVDEVVRHKQSGEITLTNKLPW